MKPSQQIKAEIRKAAKPNKAKLLQRFFKTGPGEYAQGDRFLGVVVPTLRAIVRPHRDLPLGEVTELLASAYHEDRLAGVLLLVLKAKAADPSERKRLCTYYLRQRSHINNWDLIDVSAPHLVGAALSKADREPLYRLARSARMWDRRVAIVSTFHFIRANDFTDTLRIAKLLLDDDEDLMHKSCGWMLREVGKRDCSQLETFLEAHWQNMPRTMLRYAIERFPEKRRLELLRRKR